MILEFEENEKLWVYEKPYSGFFKNMKEAIPFFLLMLEKKGNSGFFYERIIIENSYSNILIYLDATIVAKIINDRRRFIKPRRNFEGAIGYSVIFENKESFKWLKEPTDGYFVHVGEAYEYFFKSFNNSFEIDDDDDEEQMDFTFDFKNQKTDIFFINRKMASVCFGGRRLEKRRKEDI